MRGPPEIRTTGNINTDNYTKSLSKPSLIIKYSSNLTAFSFSPIKVP